MTIFNSPTNLSLLLHPMTLSLLQKKIKEKILIANIILIIINA